MYNSVAVAMPTPLGVTKKRILIAEDNRDLREIYSLALKGRFQVETAIDGQQALEKIEAQSPDLLILDLNMPNLSGLAVLEALHNKKSTSAMKIVVVTGNTVAANYAEIDDADMLLVKPVGIDVLSRLARRLLNE